MAQPPDITDTFVREVDENLRRDRMNELARKYSGWITAVLILFLGAVGGFIYWQNHRVEQSGKQVEQLSQVFADVGSGKTSAAPKQLDELANSGSKAVRASALFTRAALALQQNDVKLATAKYREIAGDDGLPKPYRDAALIRQTALEFDSLKPEEVIARLRPLAEPGNPWFGSAGEMTAMALIKQGKKGEAGQLFARIARDKQVPETLRARSVQIASTLGVDASSAFPLPAQ
ncbi:MAG TPA: tetratricopeptide repeat protein [Sphingomicrobium sp.]|nr:tetratricopeptide repeat protein [Sphingomicrobium sp.]